MTKNDLKSGMKVTLANGNVFLCIKDICYGDSLGFISLDEKETYYITLEHFKDDLTAYNHDNDIVKVEQLSIEDIDKLVKEIKARYFQEPLSLKWERIM